MIRFKRIVYFHYKICQYYQTSDTIFKYIEITHRHCFAVLRRVHYNLLVVCWNVHTAGDHVSRVVREQRSCGRGIRYSSDAVSNFAALSLFNLLSMSDSWCRIRLFIFYGLSATSVRLKLSKIRNTNRSIEETGIEIAILNFTRISLSAFVYVYNRYPRIIFTNRHAKQG